MKVRHADKKAEKIELQMTPMIDIVFQLLVFFIMTFKIVTPEGDFNIKMPLNAPAKGQPNPEMIPPMSIRLTAQSSGRLDKIKMGDKVFKNFESLNAAVRQITGGGAAGPGAAQAAEVEIDADYNLRFEYVIETITAVSGYIAENPDGETKVVKLIEKIKFAPPRTSG